MQVPRSDPDHAQTARIRTISLETIIKMWLAISGCNLKHMVRIRFSELLYSLDNCILQDRSVAEPGSLVWIRFFLSGAGAFYLEPELFIWIRSFLSGARAFYLEPELLIWSRSFLSGAGAFYLEPELFIWSQSFLSGARAFYLEPELFIWSRSFLSGAGAFYMEPELFIWTRSFLSRARALTFEVLPPLIKLSRQRAKKDKLRAVADRKRTGSATRQERRCVSTDLHCNKYL